MSSKIEAQRELREYIQTTERGCRRKKNKYINNKGIRKTNNIERFLTNTIVVNPQIEKKLSSIRSPTYKRKKQKN